MSIRTLKTIVWAPILALLLFGNGLCAEWPKPPSGQPAQMQSQVKYDPKLSDPFFKAKGRYTAKCFSSFNEPEINFCDAKLLADDTTELFIHGDAHNLRIIVQNGVFQSQYWYYYIEHTPGDELLTWTTKDQDLTLDKKVYRKGDVIKGRIYFACAEGHNDPKRAEAYSKKPSITRITGVFKTVVK
jgi:hypothetical protein